MWSPLLVLQMDDVSIVDLGDAPLGIDNALAPVSSLAALAKAFRFPPALVDLRDSSLGANFLSPSLERRVLTACSGNNNRVGIRSSVKVELT